VRGMKRASCSRAAVVDGPVVDVRAQRESQDLAERGVLPWAIADSSYSGVMCCGKPGGMGQTTSGYALDLRPSTLPAWGSTSVSLRRTCCR